MLTGVLSFEKLIGDSLDERKKTKKNKASNSKEQSLVDEPKSRKPKQPQAKLTRSNQKHSFFRRKKSSDVWQKTLTATMTTLAAPTSSSAPQQLSTETQPDAGANAANTTNGATRKNLTFENCLKNLKPFFYQRLQLHLKNRFEEVVNLSQVRKC